MRPIRRDRSRGLIVADHLSSFGSQPATLTLHVPARPEALAIVRLVLMSCGAAAGFAVEEIFSRSHDVADAFMEVLIAQPDATSVVVRTQTGVNDVDLVPLCEPETRRES